MHSIHGIINIVLFYPFEFLKNLIYKVKIIYWNLKCRSNSNLIFTINEETRDSWLHSANHQDCEIAAYDQQHFCCRCCSVTQSRLTLWSSGRQCTRLPCPSPSPGACSSSRPLSQWCHPTILSSAVPSSSCLQSCPVSGSFPMSLLFASGGQNIGALALTSVLPMNVEGWFPSGLTDLISLQSRGLSRAFSRTTVQKHQFFSIQPSLWSNFRIGTGLLGKP